MNIEGHWDRDTVAVYADELASRGDPRGELLSLDLETEAYGTTIEIDARRDALIDPVLRHRDVLARARLKPRLSTAALQAMARFEADHGVAIPASVYWWFARRHVAELFAAGGGDDAGVSLRAVGGWVATPAKDAWHLHVFDDSRRRGYGVRWERAAPTHDPRVALRSGALISPRFTTYIEQMTRGNRVDLAHLD